LFPSPERKRLKIQSNVNMKPASEGLKVCVVGAGRMGMDHVGRIARRISGAEVTAVVDVEISRAKKAVQTVPSAVALDDTREALSLKNVNAVLIATPGFLHEETVAQIGERDLPILCEKPLTVDAASSWRIVEAEQRFGKKRIQVGFMRRFDVEYQRLHSLIESGELGNLLMVHCVHRNPELPPEFTNEMLITDSVAHEFDILRYLTGSEIKAIQVRLGRVTHYSPPGLHDPQQVLIESENGVLADVEIFGNAQFGYQVATQAVFEKGIVNIGEDSGAYIRSAGRWGGQVTRTYIERFRNAYDAEVQSWVDAAKRGEIGGPTAWDGYATTACCEAGVMAQKTGGKIEVSLPAKPSIYQ
jgi:myo-inositol 2-dehydrogenase / D-chiro-inositol 1-dehydrogenase